MSSNPLKTDLSVLGQYPLQSFLFFPCIYCELLEDYSLLLKHPLAVEPTVQPPISLFACFIQFENARTVEIQIR